MLDNIFLWIGANFTDEAYILSTKIHGVLWSIADVIVILTVLNVVWLFGKKDGGKFPVVRLTLLGVSAALIPFLIWTNTPRDFYYLDSGIVMIQLFVLIYTIIRNGKDIKDILKPRLRD